MSIFNDKQILAMVTQSWICPNCGANMEFEDANEDILVCPRCFHSMDLDMYGFDSEEEYRSTVYPTLEEVLEREGIFMDEEDDGDEEDF